MTELTVQPENIRLFDKRIHVSHIWLISRFGINSSRFYRAILQANISPLHHAGQIWIDDARFYDLATHPLLERYFDDAARETVLQLLGHYDQRPVYQTELPCTGDVLGCESVDCGCLKTVAA